MQKLKKYSLQVVIVLLILSVSYLGYDKYNTSIKLKKSIQKNESDFKDFDKIFHSIIDFSKKKPLTPAYDDLIILEPEGVNVFELLPYKKYSLAFAVYKIDNFATNDSSRLEKQLQLCNVENASYSVFYNESNDEYNVPEFNFDRRDLNNNTYKFKPNQVLSDKKNNKWTFLLFRDLHMDINALIASSKTNINKAKIIPEYPVQEQHSIGPDFDLKPFRGKHYINNFDSIFYYDHTTTIKYNKIFDERVFKRIFQIVFQPPYKEGWYKLRLYSKTNRIWNISNDKYSPLGYDITPLNLDFNLLKWYIDSLYSKIKKYNIPDYRKVVVRPNDNSNLDSFYWKLTEAVNNSKSAQYSGDGLYIETYNELVKYLLPNMNKYKLDYTFSLAFDYNIFVRIPKPIERSKFEE